MGCAACGEKVSPIAADCHATKGVVMIENPAEIVLFRKVVIPTSIGDETAMPPTVGRYRNVLLVYEASGNIYLYSSDGIPTQLSTDVSDLEKEIESLSSALSLKANTADLATVAFTGEYADLLNEPQDFTDTEWEGMWA